MIPRHLVPLSLFGIHTGAHGVILAEDMLLAKSNKTLHSRHPIDTDMRRG